MTEANPRQNVTFPSNGRQAHGYLKKPAEGGTRRHRDPGVGSRRPHRRHRGPTHDQGLRRLAPDLFGGRVTEIDVAAKRSGAAVDQHPVSPALGYLLGDPDVTSQTVGIVGFCLGGSRSQLAAQQGDRINAAVAFYGVGPAVPDQYRTVTAPIQGHYGEQDAMYPVADARAQEQQIREESAGSVEFFYYPAGHAFHNDKDRLGTYNAELASLAWGRAVAFLEANAR